MSRVVLGAVANPFSSLDEKFVEWPKRGVVVVWVGPVGGGGGGVIDVSLSRMPFSWCVFGKERSGRNNHPAVAAAPTL